MYDREDNALDDYNARTERLEREDDYHRLTLVRDIDKTVPMRRRSWLERIREWWRA